MAQIGRSIDLHCTAPGCQCVKFRQHRWRRNSCRDCPHTKKTHQLEGEFDDYGRPIRAVTDFGFVNEGSVRVPVSRYRGPTVALAPGSVQAKRRLLEGSEKEEGQIFRRALSVRIQPGRVKSQAGVIEGEQEVPEQIEVSGTEQDTVTENSVFGADETPTKHGEDATRYIQSVYRGYLVRKQNNFSVRYRDSQIDGTAAVSLSKSGLMNGYRTNSNQETPSIADIEPHIEALNIDVTPESQQGMFGAIKTSSTAVESVAVKEEVGSVSLEQNEDIVQSIAVQSCEEVGGEIGEVEDIDSSDDSSVSADESKQPKPLTMDVHTRSSIDVGEQRTMDLIDQELFDEYDQHELQSFTESTTRHKTRSVRRINKGHSMTRPIIRVDRSSIEKLGDVEAEETILVAGDQIEIEEGVEEVKEEDSAARNTRGLTVVRVAVAGAEALKALDDEMADSVSQVSKYNTRRVSYAPATDIDDQEDDLNLNTLSMSTRATSYSIAATPPMPYAPKKTSGRFGLGVATVASKRTLSHRKAALKRRSAKDRSNSTTIDRDIPDAVLGAFLSVGYSEDGSDWHRRFVRCIENGVYVFEGEHVEKPLMELSLDESDVGISRGSVPFTIALNCDAGSRTVYMGCRNQDEATKWILIFMRGAQVGTPKAGDPVTFVYSVSSDSNDSDESVTSEELEESENDSEDEEEEEEEGTTNPLGDGRRRGETVKLKRRRMEILHEVLDGDRRYTQYLDATVREYLRPMFDACSANKLGGVTPRDCQLIFNNIEVIQDIAHTSIYQLEAALDEAKKEAVGSEDTTLRDAATVAGFYEELVPLLACYRSYILEFDTALSTLSRLITSKPKFKSFLQVCNQNAAKAGCSLGLMEVLALPIMRPPKYFVLLSALLSNLPVRTVIAAEGSNEPTRVLGVDESGAAAKLAITHDKFRDSFDDVRECIVRANGMLEVASVQASISGSYQSLVSWNRQFIRDGDLLKSRKSGKSGRIQLRRVFLFNDMLVYCKIGKKSDTPNEYKGFLEITDKCRVRKLERVKDIPFAFAIVEEREFVLGAASEDDRASWVRTIERVIFPPTDARVSYSMDTDDVSRFNNATKDPALSIS